MSLEISDWNFSNFLKNNNNNFNKKKILDILSRNEIDEAYKVISKWENYSPTPLLSLNKLSKKLNINKIFYKDESKRFHLKSFKALGGAYAVEKISNGKKNIIISTATAGNHGRSVAWGSQKLGLSCKIFISKFVSESRADEMRKFGAEVIRVNGNYEDSLNECIKNSKKNGWQIVQDVAWENYLEVPKLTMAGYSVMMKEISDQINNQKVSHIILQAGVGGMAAGMIAGIARYLNYSPNIIIVEPHNAACVLESIKENKIKKIEIINESILGGMSCGEVSLVPWQILKSSINYCVCVEDKYISKTIKYLAHSMLSDVKIIGGECATPGIISIIGLCNDKYAKNKIKLDENSNVLIIGCEGDADENLYQELLNKND